MPEKIYDKGEIIGNRYRVQQQLGAGAFSVVYKVLDLYISDVVALKIFKDTTDGLELIT